MLFLTMVLLGMAIGFIGMGGAGVTIALLTVVFGIPIHTALAVALSAMVFTTLSGAYSHFRENEVVVKIGAIMGIGGIIGAYTGAHVSNMLNSAVLGNMSGGIMIASAIIMYLKVYQPSLMNQIFKPHPELMDGRKLYIYGTIAGIINGFISGSCGIGAAAFIQLTLMCVFGVSLIHSVGTCMMVILPIAAAGGLGYYMNDHLDMMIFLQTLIGQSIGSYLGAKLTHLAPHSVLKFFMVAISTSGGLTMLFLY